MQSHKIYNVSQMSEIISRQKYKNNHSFNNQEQNFKNLIAHIQQLEPSDQVLTSILKLIKFYRFPIIICFHRLYSKIEQLNMSKNDSKIQILKNIATIIDEIRKTLNIQNLKQLEFFYKWGFSKKKIKILTTDIEIQFATYINRLSNLKGKIKKSMGNSQIQQSLSLISQFQTAKMSTRKLNIFEKYFENYIRASAMPLIYQIKNQSNMPIKNDLKLINKQIKYSIAQKQYEEKNIADHLCCRTFFFKDELIQQSESLQVEYRYYTFPFRNEGSSKQPKDFRLKKTICGFLNSEGGTIYMGIKQTQRKERKIDGIPLTEQKKHQFKKQIYTWIKDIRPQIGIKCEIKFVPIRDQKTKQYYSGQYVAKIIVERGAKDQLYSINWSDEEIFVFRVDSQNLILNSKNTQQILNIFKNKIENPEQPKRKLHKYPCKEPELGCPIYSDQQKQENKQLEAATYQIHLGRQDYKKNEEAYRETENRKQQIKQKKKYLQKSKVYLLRSAKKETIQDVQNQFKINLKHIQIEENQYGKHYLIYLPDNLSKQKKDQLLVKFKQNSPKIVYSSIVISKESPRESLQAAKLVIQDGRKHFNIIKENQSDNVLILRNHQDSAKLFLKFQEIGIKIQFENKH